MRNRKESALDPCLTNKTQVTFKKADQIKSRIRPESSIYFPLQQRNRRNCGLLKIKGQKVDMQDQRDYKITKGEIKIDCERTRKKQKRKTKLSEDQSLHYK